MSDFISRQALCDDLREYKVHPVPISSDESEVKGYNDGIDLAISVIAEFPSVEPERKTGKWIGEWDTYWYGEPIVDIWRCSVCDKVFDEWEEKPDWKYCPNCGAKMEDPEDEEE